MKTHELRIPESLNHSSRNRVQGIFATVCCGVLLLTLCVTPALAADQATPPEAPKAEAAQKAADDLPVIVPQPVKRPRYAEVYRSIPFSRAEYEANPSYRHESTIELMLGQIRPVYKYYSGSGRPGVFTMRPYSYYRGRRWTSYNFYYPWPTAYRNY